MLPADMGGSAADLRRGLMALSAFKKRVDDLLTDFEKSAGGSSKLGAHSLTPAAFGMGDFPEAKSLHSEYERVHERITALSKSLGLQMEAMQIAVHGVDINFNNLEDEERYRFHQIRMQVNQGREEMLHEESVPTNKAGGAEAGY